MNIFKIFMAFILPLLLHHFLSTNSWPLLKNIGPTQAPWQWAAFLQAGTFHIRSVSVQSKGKHSGTGFGPEEKWTSWEEEENQK